MFTDLKEKDPEPEPPSEHGLLLGQVRTVPHYFYEPIDEQEIMKAALKTKCSAGPPGMDADAFRRILTMFQEFQRMWQGLEGRDSYFNQKSRNKELFFRASGTLCECSTNSTGQKSGC